MARLKIKQYNLVQQFKCLGDKCENHCCGTWNVGVDKQTVEKYKLQAPELMEFVEPDGAKEDGFHLTHSPTTNFCSLLDDQNLCAIHKKYGHAMLPEICRLYPKTFRSLHDKIIVSPTTSCPEIARLAIFGEEPFKLVDSAVEDFPAYSSNYGRPGETSEDMFYVMRRFQKETTRKDIGASEVVYRILIASFMLDHYESKGWRKVIDFVFDHLEFNTLPCRYVEYNEPVEPFRLLKHLFNIRVGGHPRWFAMFETASARFGGAKFDAPIEEGSPVLDQAFLERVMGNKATTKKLSWVMKNFIASDLMRAMFPYAGVGGSVYERAMVLAGQYSVTRLMMILHCQDDGECVTDYDIARIVQTISRHTTHLSKDIVQYYRDHQMEDLVRLKEALFMFEAIPESIEKMTAHVH